MIRRYLGLILVVLPGLLHAAKAKPLWLAVAGSFKTLAPAMGTMAKLRPLSPGAGIVASSDCENLAPGWYLPVADVSADRGSVQAALGPARTVATDAYVRECRPKADSRILLGVPVIDPSIEQVPQDAVNWTDEDRISTIVKLAGGGFLWFRRTYVAAPEDPREGRRTSVQFFRTGPQKSIQLCADCADPSISAVADRIALGCARETAADNLLHEIRVYDRDSGKELMNIPRCRNPKLMSRSKLACQAEQVDRVGVLHLHAKWVKLP